MSPRVAYIRKITVYSVPGVKTQYRCFYPFSGQTKRVVFTGVTEAPEYCGRRQ